MYLLFYCKTYASDIIFLDDSMYMMIDYVGAVLLFALG